MQTAAFPLKFRARARWRARVAAAALAGLLGVGLLATLPASAAAKPAPSIYWGAQIGPQMTGEQAPWDMRPVHRFQKIAGKGLSLVEFGAPFAECGSAGCLFGKFPTTPLDNVRSYGAIPIFSWSSASNSPNVRQPNFQLSDVISGRYDSFIREFAIEAREWHHPFFLRFDWEMNGFWFPWGEGVNGNRPGEYVAAWRHVHNIFTSVGARNATWVWCPNVDIFGRLPNLRSLYPGGRYVDWTCVDGFNWGDRRGSPGWLSFDRIFHSTYKTVANLAPTKPMMLAETASSEKGGSKPKWIKDMYKKIRTGYRKVRGVVWYDVNDRGTGWPIETSNSASNAFRQAVSNGAYRPNIFGQIGAIPIPPPPPR
jgi:hypothetical protein